MRDYNAATLAQLQSRRGLVARVLVWIEARNRVSGAAEAMGIWSGEDDALITVEGQPRAYLGAGALLAPEPVSAGSGLQVRSWQLRLSAVSPEVEDLVKGYDTRFCRVTVHRGLLDPNSRLLVAEPHRVFRGFLDKIDFPAAEPGGMAAAVLDLVSETRVLTRGLAAKKSHESQLARAPGDAFRQYGDIAGAVPVYWGEERAPGAPAASAPFVNPFRD